MTHKRQLKRRDVLAGMGAIGLLSVGAGLGWGRPPAYTQYTYAQSTGESSDSILRVAWYETYNGVVQETQGSTTTTDANATLDPAQSPAYIEEASGPIITLPDVVPGDEGTLFVGLEAVDVASNVYFLPTLTGTADNGINEPERRAGDTTDGASGGELQEYVEVRVYEDTGVLGSGIGACDGRFVGDPELTNGWTAMADLDGVFPERDLLRECLQPGSTFCLGLEWRIPEDVGNVIQTDSVAFTLAFTAEECVEGTVEGSE
jgi:hypothetical protein